jgi:hypothetical protein
VPAGKKRVPWSACWCLQVPVGLSFWVRLPVSVSSIFFSSSYYSSLKLTVKKNLECPNRLSERLCGSLKKISEKKSKKVLTAQIAHAILKTTTISAP